MTVAGDGAAVEFRTRPTSPLQKILVVAVAGVALAVYVCLQAGWQPILGVAVALGVVGLLWISGLGESEPTTVKLRIDGAGIHADGMQPRTVVWSRIKEIEFNRQQRMPVSMWIFLDDAAGARPVAEGVFAALDRTRELASILDVPVEGLDGDPHDIAAAIARFSPATPVVL